MHVVKVQTDREDDKGTFKKLAKEEGFQRWWKQTMSMSRSKKWERLYDKTNDMPISAPPPDGSSTISDELHSLNELLWRKIMDCLYASLLDDYHLQDHLEGNGLGLLHYIYKVMNPKWSDKVAVDKIKEFTEIKRESSESIEKYFGRRNLLCYRLNLNGMPINEDKAMEFFILGLGDGFDIIIDQLGPITTALEKCHKMS